MAKRFLVHNISPHNVSVLGSVLRRAPKRRSRTRSLPMRSFCVVIVEPDSTEYRIIHKLLASGRVEVTQCPPITQNSLSTLPTWVRWLDVQEFVSMASGAIAKEEPVPAPAGEEEEIGTAGQEADEEPEMDEVDETGEAEEEEEEEADFSVDPPSEDDDTDPEEEEEEIGPPDLHVSEEAEEPSTSGRFDPIDFEVLLSGEFEDVPMGTLREWGAIFDPPVKGVSKDGIATEILAAAEELGLL